MRKFERIEDDLNNHVFRRMSDGEVFVGIYPVIFGFRIRAGFLSDKLGVSLDYCAGADELNISEIYAMVLHILKNQKKKRD